MAARLGIVTGLAAEAEALRAGRIEADIRCGGSSTERARLLARQLVAEGATALLSFGVGGSLANIVLPGQVVVAEAVALPDGRRIACEPAWRLALADRLTGLPVKLHGGLMVGSDVPVCDAPAKHALRRQTGGMAVDMESHAVAEVAADAGVPFLVLRAVSDAVDQTVPAFAMGGVDEQGRTRIAPVLLGLLRQPRALPDLLTLGRHFSLALDSLRHAARLASPDLGWHTGS
jgi:hopanoid-associated phosphorylase